MTIGWGGVSRIDLEPAGCSDPECDADHGYTGVLASDDFSLRVSAAADGNDAVAGLLSFAESLSARTHAGDQPGTRTGTVFVEPAYHQRSLGDVVPAVAAALGVPIGEPPSGLVLPEATSYVVFLIDGLGSRLLERYAHAAPYLASLLEDQAPGTAGVPSTTATSLTSLGTGLTPGRPRPGRLHLPGARHRPAPERAAVGPRRRPAGVAAAPDRVRPDDRAGARRSPS